MHLTVHIPEQRVLELNYMWLPTFVGMNTELKKEIEGHIKPMVEGKEVCDELLDQLDAEIISFIRGKYPDVQRLDSYLEALRGVHIPRE